MALKILIADDSMIAQNMGKKILTDAGYEVVAVSNGAAAVKKLTEVRPDIILLDVYMPGYNGLEVCERVKNAPETARIPVLLTVGKLEPFRPEDGMKAKADGLIIKPFEATDLLTVVSKLAERVHAAPPAAVAPPARVVAESEPEPLEAVRPRVQMPREMAGAPALMDEFVVESAPASVPVELEPPVPAPGFTVEREPAMDFELVPSPEPPEIPAAPVEPAPVPAAETAPAEAEVSEPAPVAEAISLPPFMADPAEQSLEAATGLPAMEIRFEVTPAPDLEFTSAPIATGAPAETLPDLEPTIAQQEGGEAVAQDLALITNSSDITTPATLSKDESFEEPPEIAVFHSNHEPDQHSEARVTATMEAFEQAAAIPEERPLVQPPEFMLEPLGPEAELSAPVSYLDAALSSEDTQARAAAASVAPVAPPKTAEPIRAVRAPLGKTSFDDNLGRALESMLADAVNAQNQEQVAEVPRSLDEVDEALGLTPQPPFEVTEVAEPEQEIVIPPKEERVNVSFGPDVGDAQEVVEPARVEPPVTAPKPATHVAPLSVPPVQPVEVHPVASMPAAMPAAAEEKPSASREQALASVDKALDAVNRAIAEQVVQRLLERVRPELVEEVVRLLKQG